MSDHAGLVVHGQSLRDHDASNRRAEHDSTITATGVRWCQSVPEGRAMMHQEHQCRRQA